MSTDRFDVTQMTRAEASAALEEIISHAFDERTDTFTREDTPLSAERQAELTRIAQMFRLITHNNPSAEQNVFPVFFFTMNEFAAFVHTPAELSFFAAQFTPNDYSAQMCGSAQDVAGLPASANNVLASLVEQMHVIDATIAEEDAFYASSLLAALATIDRLRARLIERALRVSPPLGLLESQQEQ